MKQYEVGKRFCDAVVRDYGIEGLNRAWFAPELLPTLDRARGSRRLGAADAAARCNSVADSVYKHVFAGHTHCEGS